MEFELNYSYKNTQEKESFLKIIRQELMKEGNFVPLQGLVLFGIVVCGLGALLVIKKRWILLGLFSLPVIWMIISLIKEIEDMEKGITCSLGFYSIVFVGSGFLIVYSGVLLTVSSLISIIKRKIKFKR